MHDTGPPVTRPRVYELSGSPRIGPLRINPVSRRYWAAIPEDERDAIEAAIPEGHIVYIGVGWRGKPGTCDVSLRRQDPANTWHVVRQVRGRLTARLVWSVLRGEVVTTDAAGFVTSIEEAS